MMALPLPHHAIQRGIRRMPCRGCPLPSRRHNFDHRENLAPRRSSKIGSPLDSFSRDLLDNLPAVHINEIKSKLNADPGDPYVMLGQYLNTFPYLDYFSARHLNMITGFQQFSSITPPAFVNDKKGLVYLSFQINRYTFYTSSSHSTLFFKICIKCLFVTNLFYSLFDELESQRRFLLDESVQSAFLRQIGVDKQRGERDVASEQQPGGPQQPQPADKAEPTEGSNASTARQGNPNISAGEEQKGSSRDILSSRPYDSSASTAEFLDCLF